MGHAIYTLSDPRAVIIKRKAEKLVKQSPEFVKEFELYKLVEELTPAVFEKVKNNGKVMCANVDLYSGLVYRMLDIPVEMYTPLFAISRVAGWCAHRMEEYCTSNKIIRPAYKCITPRREYVPLDERN
mgnify:CR=1 FL=1